MSYLFGRVNPNLHTRPPPKKKRSGEQRQRFIIYMNQLRNEKENAEQVP